MLCFSWRENERISTKEDLFHGIDLEQFTMQVVPKLLVNQKKQ
jgi:hypothetical protein